MFRTVLLGIALLALVTTGVGCPGFSGPRNDMEVKGMAGTNKKGQTIKTFEAALEDPNAKKK
jgi:hypothetical protein